ncbi:MAG: 50S ribosomal protein L9 [Lachnospiraceae bacterium]|nr:50S ribosomal protein L9 [Lachnospiraceae bacterium]
MQVILLQDVKSLGKKGDIVKVSDGYARNYVLPKKLGVEANEKNKNELKLQKAHEDKVAAQKLAQAQQLAADLEKIKITVTMRAGENGRVFGSIGAKEIAAAAKEQHGLDLDKKKIQLAEPIKSFGMVEVPIKLHTQVTGRLYVLVQEQ